MAVEALDVGDSVRLTGKLLFSGPVRCRDFFAVFDFLPVQVKV